MKLLRKIFPAVAVALAAGPALAVIDGSHHDLRAFQGASEACLYCHGVFDATANTGNYGDVGELCLSRCHNGSGLYVPYASGVTPNRPASISEAGVVIPAVDSPTVVNVNFAGGYAHGLNKANLFGPFGTASGQEAFDPIGQAFPYASGTGSLQCTSCHNVHDNTNTPFLQAPLFTGGPAARPSFCEACHTSRGNSWAAGETLPNGEHPTNFALSAAGDRLRTLGARIGRFINLDGNVFDEATPNGTALNDPAQHYVTGGKIGTWGNASGAAGETFGCYTCHAVHTDSLGAAWQAPYLILRDAVSSTNQWNPICTGCHGEEATGIDDPNPGLAASAFFHPVGSSANPGTVVSGGVIRYTASTGTFQFNVDMTRASNPGSVSPYNDTVVGFDLATPANGLRPRCGSCHDVHGGFNDSMALVDLDGTRNGLNPGNMKVCDACHTGVGIPDVADNSDVAMAHHVTRTGSWATATVTDADGDTLNLDGTNAASWLTAQDHTNGLDCADCHVFDGSTHSTAHNW